MNQKAQANLARFCAYQERSPFEVLEKMERQGVPPEEMEEIIHWLEENNFLNENRFARTFAQSKFNSSKWGKIKIRFHLENKKITKKAIEEALNSIDNETYLEALEQLITEKGEKVLADNTYKKNYKIARFLIARGFEPDLIWHYLRV